MRTLKEIYTEISQDTTLIKTFSTYELDEALKGSEKDMVEAFSHFFARAHFAVYFSDYDDTQLLEYRLLSEFIKEIKPGCSSDIQRITSELMKNKKLSAKKKDPILLACLSISSPEKFEPQEGWFTTLSKSARSEKIDAEFAFAQILVYLEVHFHQNLVQYPAQGCSQYFKEIFDMCADNPTHLSMPTIFLEFLQRYSQAQKSPDFYFLSITLKHGLTNIINENKYPDPAGLVQRLSEWCKNNLDLKNESDCFFLTKELPSLMVDCLIDERTKALSCLEEFLSHCIRNPESRENLAKVLINSNQLKLIEDKHSENPVFSELLEATFKIKTNSVPIRLSLFLASIRHFLADTKREKNTFEIEFSPARAMAQVGINPQPSGANKSNSLSDKQFDSCAATLN